MNSRGHKYQITITVEKVTLAVKLTCKMMISLKRGNSKIDFQTQGELKGGQVIFNDSLTNNFHVSQNEKGEHQSKVYQLDFTLITEKGNKTAGFCQFDIASYLNANKLKISEQFKLEKCPDKNATCFLNISLQQLQEIDAEREVTGNESFDNSKLDTKSDSKVDISHTSDYKISSPTMVVSPKPNLDTPFISDSKNNQVLNQVYISKFDQNIEYSLKEMTNENVKLKQQIQELLHQSQKQEQQHQQEIINLRDGFNKQITKINQEYAQQLDQYKQQLKQKEEQHKKDENKQLELSRESINLKELVEKQQSQLQEIEKQVNEQIRLKINEVKQQYDVSLNGYKQSIEQKDLIIKQLQEQKNGTFVEYKNEKSKPQIDDSQLNKIISEKNIKINELLNQQQKNKEEIILYTNKLAQMQKLITKYEFSINETEATKKISELEQQIEKLQINPGMKSPRENKQLTIEIPKQHQQDIKLLEDQLHQIRIENQKIQARVIELENKEKQQEEQLKNTQFELDQARDTINNLKTNPDSKDSTQNISLQELKIQFEAEKISLSKQYQKIILENSTQSEEAISKLESEVVRLKGRIGDMFNAAYNMSGPRLVEKMQVALGLK